MEIYLAIVLLGLLAGFISGLIGTGGSIIMLPALSWAFGPQVAVPAMAVASIMSNLSRVMIWWSKINWRACMVYAVCGVPGAVIGANTLWHLPEDWSSICIGSFFLLLIPLMRIARQRELTLSLFQLGLGGLLIGFLTGVVFSTGPLTIPLFAGFGLIKEALIATEAAASLLVFLSKASTFGAVGGLTLFVVLVGLLTGGALTAGIYFSRGLVSKMPERYFHRLVAGMLCVAGVSMLCNGLLR